MLQIEKTEEVNIPQIMINYSAFYDSLVSNDLKWSEQIYKLMLKDEQDPTQGIAYFMMEHRHLVSNANDSANDFPICIRIWKEFAERYGYQKFLIYVLMRQHLRSLYFEQQKTEQSQQYQMTAAALRSMHQIITTFPETLIPDGSFRPFKQPEEFILEELVELIHSFLSPELMNEVLKNQRLKPMGDRNHIGIVERFIPESWCTEILVQMNLMTFFRKDHSVEGLFDYDICSGPLVIILDALLNTPLIKKVVASITNLSEAEIHHFIGRLYMIGEDCGFEDWHMDCTAENKKILGFSLDLSPKPYEGGALALKGLSTNTPFQSAKIERLGDAMLFRLAPNLLHRVLPICGANMRFAFVGWYIGEEMPGVVLLPE